MTFIRSSFDYTQQHFSSNNLPPNNTGTSPGTSITSPIPHSEQPASASVLQQSQNRTSAGDAQDLDALLRLLGNKDSLAELDRSLDAMPKNKRGVEISKLAKIFYSPNLSKDIKGEIFSLLKKHLPNTPPQSCLQTLAFLANSLTPAMPSQNVCRTTCDPADQEPVVTLIRSCFPKPTIDPQCKFFACSVVKSFAQALCNPGLSAELHEPIVNFMSLNLYAEQHDALIPILKSAQSNDRIREPAKGKLALLLSVI